MDKLFLDSDVILDFLLDRKPFHLAAADIINKADVGIIKLYSSSIALNNVHYIARRILGNKKSLIMLEDLLAIIEVVPTGKKEMIEAIKRGFSDYEDGLQHATAQSVKGLNCIITRNIKDFKKSELTVLEPTEWLRINDA